MINVESKETSVNKFIVGPHVHKDVVSVSKPITDHIKSAIEVAKEYGVSIGIIQIFMSNPRNGKLLIEPESSTYKELKTLIEQHAHIKFIIHSPYTSNALWSGNQYSAYTLRHDLKHCDDLGLIGTVFHLDKHDVDDVIKFLPNIMPKLPEKQKPGLAKFYLESPHTKPDKSLYETPKKILKLFTAIRKNIDPYLNRIGFCLDTAHIWTSGVDIEEYKSAYDWLVELTIIQTILPPENIVFHLNGSYYNCGDGRDKHAPLMSSEDKIWGKYKDNFTKSGLYAFIEYAKRFSIPTVLERHHAEEYYSDYKLLYDNESTIRIKKEL